MARILRIPDAVSLAVGSGKVVETDGKTIALFNVEGEILAIDNECPHRGGPLGEGALDGHVVTCPLHGAQFDVRTGEVLRPPAASGVRRYPVRVDGQDVLIELD